MDSSERQKLIQKIRGFLVEIGIPVDFKPVEMPSFLPGIMVESGRMIIDTDKLEYPGDILHEAGHMALEPEGERKEMNGDFEPEGYNAQSVEIGAILWSYAASVYLDLDPRIVFHEEGYKGASDWHIHNFQSGNYIGLPLLQWMGLCKRDDEPGGKPFPHMLRWLRGDE